MAGKRDPNKKLVQAWLDKGLVLQIDAEAERLGCNRSDVLLAAVREHLAHDPVPASSAELAEVKAAMALLAGKLDDLAEDSRVRSDALALAVGQTAAVRELPGTEPRRLTLRERITGRVVK